MPKKGPLRPRVTETLANRGQITSTPDKLLRKKLRIYTLTGGRKRLVPNRVRLKSWISQLNIPGAELTRVYYIPSEMMPQLASAQATLASCWKQR